jgi:hypothetical protein
MANTCRWASGEAAGFGKPASAASMRGTVAPKPRISMPNAMPSAGRVSAKRSSNRPRAASHNHAVLLAQSARATRISGRGRENINSARWQKR